jgi:hypothetical protein
MGKPCLDICHDVVSSWHLPNLIICHSPQVSGADRFMEGFVKISGRRGNEGTLEPGASKKLA